MPNPPRSARMDAAWRSRALRVERQLRLANAQIEILTAVLRSVLDGATPEMIAACEARIAEGAGRDATGTNHDTGDVLPPG